MPKIMVDVQLTHYETLELLALLMKQESISPVLEQAYMVLFTALLNAEAAAEQAMREYATANTNPTLH